MEGSAGTAEFGKGQAQGLGARPVPWRREARRASALALALADAAAWLAATGLVVLFRMAVWGPSALFWGLWLTGLGWLLFRFAAGLYPPVGISQPEELKRSFRTTVAAALVHFAMLYGQQELSGPRLAGLGVWFMVVPLAYFARSVAKLLLLRRGLYGDPFVVIGTGEKAARAIREMRANPELGLLPVAAFAVGPGRAGGSVEGVPVLGPVEAAAGYPFPYPVSRALVALGRHEADFDRVEAIATGLARSFWRLHVMADLAAPTTMWAETRTIGPYLALEMRHARFSGRQKRVKRAFDLAVAVPVLTLAAPFVAVAALAVKAASPGPAFYSQTREGPGGRPIRIWKLRTMVVDADRRLAEHLAADPAARHEWERTLKLRNDPRVIPGVGAFLRKSSVDELPQLWTVIQGGMSLVGPRVMPVHEVNRYTEAGRALRRDVPPGLTGFWQIMYRNNSDLRIREIADSHYVNNWSVWLDAWILLRTVRVVLFGSGAY
jgi:Undecaprenyl-phosphate galactose phosphotransferase WbaP